MLAAPLLLLPSAVRAQAWSEFRNDEGNYRIRMPGAPALQVVPISVGNDETAPMIEAFVRTPAAAYQVAHVTYPRRVAQSASADVLLDRFRNNMAAGSTYRGEKRLSLGRFPGREFLVLEAGGRNTAVRLYWVRGRLYQLMVTGAVGIETTPDTRTFMESFALISP